MDLSDTFQDSLSLAPTVVGIVQRCGCYLRKITFGQRWLKISQTIADTIAGYRKHLKFKKRINNTDRKYKKNKL